MQFGPDSPPLSCSSSDLICFVPTGAAGPQPEQPAVQTVWCERACVISLASCSVEPLICEKKSVVNAPPSV